MKIHVRVLVLILFFSGSLFSESLVVFKNFSKKNIELTLKDGDIKIIVPGGILFVSQKDYFGNIYTVKNDDDQFGNKIKDEVSRFFSSKITTYFQSSFSSSFPSSVSSSSSSSSVSSSFNESKKKSSDSAKIIWIGFIESDNQGIAAVKSMKDSLNAIALSYVLDKSDFTTLVDKSFKQPVILSFFRQPVFSDQSSISIPTKSDLVQHFDLSIEAVNAGCPYTGKFIIMRNFLQETINVQQQCDKDKIFSKRIEPGAVANLIYDSQYSNNYEIRFGNSNKKKNFDRNFKNAVNDLFKQTGLTADGEPSLIASKAIVWVVFMAGDNEEIAAVKSNSNGMNALILTYMCDEKEKIQSKTLSKFGSHSESKSIDKLILPAKRDLIQYCSLVLTPEKPLCDENSRKKWGDAYIQKVEDYIRATQADIESHRSRVMQNMPSLGNIPLRAVYWKHILSPNCKNLSGFHHDYKGYFRNLAVDAQIAGTKMQFSDVKIANSSQSNPALFFHTQKITWGSFSSEKSFFPDDMSRSQIMDLIMNAYRAFITQYNEGKADFFICDENGNCNAKAPLSLRVGKYYAVQPLDLYPGWSIGMIFEIIQEFGGGRVMDMKTAFPCISGYACSLSARNTDEL